MITLAVDCMGGDFGPSATLPACKRFLDANPQTTLLLVGLPQALEAWVEHERAQLLPCTEVVSMDDSVEVALRKKKDSSMRVGINQVKQGNAQACVSAGNTGALMAIARYLLKTMQGIDRPAIAALFPNAKEKATLVLDLGANIDCESEHLLQFAIMGSALYTSLDLGDNPSIGLLNVGEELIKGNDTIKRAGELLRQANANGDLSFIGNVEGNDIYSGKADIVVCDGFVGNAALKASEGLSKMVSTFLKEAFTRNWASKLSAVIAMPVLNSLRQQLDHRRYNGAALLGLNGLVFKSHGSADSEAFYQALAKAHAAAQRDLLAHVREQVERSAAGISM